MNEETFWRNYFYRVSLIKQSAQVSSMTRGDHVTPEPTPTTSEQQPITVDVENLQPNLDESESAKSDGAEKSPTARLASSPEQHEFVSDVDGVLHRCLQAHLE